MLLRSGAEAPEAFWATRPNGDLWCLIQRALRSRGWHSVKATKIKAHLDRQAQERGEISPWHRFGNEAADIVAG
eukprot:13781121-Alexandrium_andersonii.AAC.1